MKEITLYRHERMLFALLRASLHERKTEITLFLDSTDEEWKQCHRLAVSQGVMALAWDGVMRLPAELQPPLSVKLAWAAAVERYEKKYLHYCRTADELSRFYAQHGISAMQMKGVGLSAIYPVPCHREGGDIDIYTYSADKSRMSDGEANQVSGQPDAAGEHRRGYGTFPQAQRILLQRCSGGEPQDLPERGEL